jgi:hypothetical protein
MGRPIAVIAEGLPDRPGLEERLHGASAAGAAQLFAGAHAARVRNTEREWCWGAHWANFRRWHQEPSREMRFLSA